MTDYCAMWLLEYLHEKGRVNVDAVRKDAKKIGWTRKELKSARAEIGVKTWHDARADVWYWYV